MKNKQNNKQTNSQHKQKGFYMKTKISVFAAAFCAFVLLGTSSAFAAGTPAGTQIKNYAMMTYQDLSSNTFPTLYSDTAVVTVEQVAGVTINAGTLELASDSMHIAFPHTVTNTGNGTDTYTLSVIENQSWSAALYIDTDKDGVWDSNETTPVPGGVALAADSTYKIIVHVFVPNGVASSLLDTIRTMVIGAYDDTSASIPKASTWSRDSILTRVANIGVTKTRLNATPAPGDTITYTVDYVNNGTGQANSAYLVDTLDVNVTYLPLSAAVNSGGGTVSLDSLGSRRLFFFNLGSSGDIVGGAGGQVTYKVTVNSGVTNGVEIKNTAYVVYIDSISERTKHPYDGPKISTVTGQGQWNLKVSAIANSFVENNDDDSTNVSQKINFKLKLKNLGNRADTARWDRNSSLSLSWQLFRDIDKSGTLSVGDTELGIADSLIIVAYQDSAMFIAVDTIAQNVSDRSLDSADYQFSSVTLGATTSGYHLTRIKAPVMVLTKTAVGAVNGRTRPGDTIVYVITYSNTGSGAANQIVISDIISGGLLSNVTYVPNSVAIDNSSHGGTGNGALYDPETDADNSGDDDTIVTSSLITVNIGNVSPGLGHYLSDASYTGKIKFKVTINN